VQLLRRLLRDDAVDPPLWRHRGDRVVQLVAHVDLDKCRGCKKCARACPAQAVTMVDNEGQGLRKYWAIVDPDACLGCGVCDDLCRFDAHSMVPRDQRVFTPETTFDRMVAMAVERGKLGDLLVDTLDGVGPHALARVCRFSRPCRPSGPRGWWHRCDRCSCGVCSPPSTPLGSAPRPSSPTGAIRVASARAWT
jgi:ferredoxin